MRIISFSGPIGCGKDTACDIVSRYLMDRGKTCRNISFASKIKDNLSHLFYWDRDRLENDQDYKEGNTLPDGSIDPACEKLGMTRREVMQIYGSEAMRSNLHADVWIITVEMDIIHGKYDDVDYGFLSDARFMNELKFVKRNGGSTWRIDRHGDNSPCGSGVSSHISEMEWRGWNNWDWVIDNTIQPDQPDHYNLDAFRNYLLQNVEEHLEKSPMV